MSAWLSRPIACLVLACLLPGIGATAAAVATEAGPRSAPASASADDVSGARVIVKYRALGSLMRGADAATPGGPQHAAAMARRHGLALSDGRVIDRRSQVLRGGTGITSSALAARLAADPEVEYAVVDQRRYALALPGDPLLQAGTAISPAAGQWYLRAPDATFVSAINAVDAWSVTPGSASVVVADLDTGVLFSHPDVAAKLYPGYDFITSSSTAGDGGGRDTDATDPGDWTNANECGRGVAATTSSWHGTQTAGLIGAQTDNGIGMASVGRNVMLLPVRVLGRCGGTDSDIIAAMLWAGGITSTPTANPHPARVINLSLGSTGSCSAAYLDAIGQLAAAGVVVVVAAGNEEGLAVSSPANCSGVIAVGGLRHTGTKVGYSSVGPEVAISAPAGNCVNSSGACLYPILTTTNTGTTTAAANTYSDSSNYSVGTSFSSPLVAGTVALMLSANPSLTPAGVRGIVQRTARSFPTGSTTSTTQCHAPDGSTQDECVCTTSTCGAGMLDAAAAVTAAAAGAAAPTAVITADATSVVTGRSVNLSATGSAVAGGRTISAYRWTLTAGSGIAAFAGGTDGATAQVDTTGAGSFTVQLTVTDSTGQQGTASTTVQVNAPAAPTVQILSSTQVVAAGGSVVFDGSGSAVASGLSVAGYQWAIVSGAGLASFGSSTTAATATLSTLASGSGTVTVRLTVTDSLGQQASATSTVTVTAVTPLASITASSLTAAVGGAVSFDGSGSTASGGRTIAGYEWSIVSGGGIAAFSGAANASAATVVASGTGSYTVQLKVTDSGGSTDIKTATVTVSAAGAAGTTAASSGSGGGGAAGWPWALGLLAAAGALRARRLPHRRAHLDRCPDSRRHKKLSRGC